MVRRGGGGEMQGLWDPSQSRVAALGAQKVTRGLAAEGGCFARELTLRLPYWPRAGW